MVAMQNTPAGRRALETNAAVQTPADALVTVDKMIAKSEEYDLAKRDYKGGSECFSFTDDGKMQFIGVTQQLKGLTITDESAPLGFTDYAFGQLLERMSRPYFGNTQPATKLMRREDWETMRRNYPVQFASIMNDVLSKYAAKTRNSGLLMRTYDETIRAMFTSLYGIVDNTEMLKAVHSVLSESASELPGLRVVRSEVTPDDMLLQVVWKNVDSPNADANRPGDGFSLGEGSYGAGFLVRNGETGRNGISITPAIWRGPCTNSIFLKTEQAFAMRHVGTSADLLATIKVSTYKMLPMMDKALQMAFEAEVQQLPSIADVINGFAKEYKWSDKVKSSVLLGTEGRHTKMGLVNGVSYAAHAATGGNTDLMVDMSTLAGAMLMQPVSYFEKRAAK